MRRDEGKVPRELSRNLGCTGKSEQERQRQQRIAEEIEKCHFMWGGGGGTALATLNTPLYSRARYFDS